MASLAEFGNDARLLALLRHARSTERAQGPVVLTPVERDKIR